MYIHAVLMRPKHLIGCIMTSYKMPAIALRSLLDMYQRQCMRTVWKAKFSRQFGTSNGIRQVAVVSPVLICIYMD